MTDLMNEEPDPDAARFLTKVRWMMAIAAATTLIAIAAVLGVIGYRFSRVEGSVVDATARVPKGARVIATAVADDRIVVTLDIAGAVEIRIYDVRTLKQVGRLTFASEP